MKAAVVRHGGFALEDIAEPVAASGQVLLKTRACGICGSDVHMLRHGAEMMETQREMGLEPDNLVDGLVLGHEFVAEIEAYGPDTQQALPVGTRVCGLPFLLTDTGALPIGATTKTTGAYAEKMIASEATLMPVPDHLPDAGAALAEPVAIGVHAVNKADMTGDEPCVVVGCGPIGLAVIAVLKNRGVQTIIAADFSAKRRALAEKMGATQVVDPGEGSAYAGLNMATAAVIFECTGVNGVLAQMVIASPLGSKIVVAGIANGDDAFKPMLAVAKELIMIFVTYYAPEEFADALNMLADGKIDWQAWVTAEMSLAEVQSAFDLLMGGDEHAKILLRP